MKPYSRFTLTAISEAYRDSVKPTSVSASVLSSTSNLIDPLIFSVTEFQNKSTDIPLAQVSDASLTRPLRRADGLLGLSLWLEMWYYADGCSWLFAMSIKTFLFVVDRQKPRKLIVINQRGHVMNLNSSDYSLFTNGGNEKCQKVKPP